MKSNTLRKSESKRRILHTVARSDTLVQPFHCHSAIFDSMDRWLVLIDNLFWSIICFDSGFQKGHLWFRIFKTKWMRQSFMQKPLQFSIYLVHNIFLVRFECIILYLFATKNLNLTKNRVCFLQNVANSC